MGSNAELLLSVQLRDAGIFFEREVRFAPSRRFRADFAIGDEMLLVEVEGGTWVEGRHSRGAGFERDCEKQALAVIRGYRYLRVTSSQVENGTALGWIKAALGLSEVAA